MTRCPPCRGERGEEVDARLSSEHQDVLRLRCCEDLSRTEIAAVPETPSGLLATRSYEGMRRLRATRRRSACGAGPPLENDGPRFD